MSSMCQYDSQCPLPSQACYTNVSWYHPQPGENGCLCSTYYGFTGPQCDEIFQTNTGRIWLGFGIVILLILCLLLIVSLYTVARLKVGGLLSLSAETVGTLQIVASACFGIVYNIGFIWAAAEPSLAYYGATPTDDRENVDHKVWQGLMVVHVVTSLGAAATIALVWVNVANKAKHFRQGGDTSLRSYQVGLAIVEIAFLIAFIVPVAMGKASIGVLVAFFALIVTVAIYAAGYKMLLNVILSLSMATSSEHNSDGALHSPNPYKTVMKEMQHILLWIFLFLVIALGLIIALFITMVSAWKETSGPSFSLIVFFTQAVSLCVACFSALIMSFLLQNAQRKWKRSNVVSVVLSSDAKLVGQ